jgi:TolA-binding protein
MNRFDNVAQSLAELQDELIQESGVSEQVRTRVLAQLPIAPRSAQRGRTATLAAMGMAAMVAAGVALFFSVRPSEPTFWIGDEARAGQVGAWMSPSSGASLPVSFSDGSRVVLGTNAQARVTTLAPDRADIVLERGHIKVNVKHQQARRWELRAGPFAVLVRGTRFEVQWQPERSDFALQLAHGKLEVRGPGISGVRRLSNGESLRVRQVSGKWLALDAAATAEAVLPPAAAEPVGDVSSSPRSVRGAPAVGRAVTSAKHEPALAPDVPTWQELAQSGDYVGAVAGAREIGIARILVNAPAADLLSLAQAARFAGDTGLARRALRGVRERFAGSAAAAVATYDLGRLAFDTSGRYLEAAHWFSRYLRDHPGGGLAREASGRLVEALDRSGDRRGAKEAARDYLTRYPNGPHAPLARRLTAR